MAFNKSLSISSATPTQHIVQRAHFGGNALHRVNISDEAQVMSHFAQSASALGLSDLRYPGGGALKTPALCQVVNSKWLPLVVPS